MSNIVDINDYLDEPDMSTIEYIKKLEAEIKVEHNKYLSALAEAENIKKNYAKKQADLYAYRYEDIFKELVEVIDDAERAANSENVDSGSLLIFSKLGLKLYKLGLMRFHPDAGEEFDADTMEAISVVDMGEGYTGKVVETTLTGYKYNGKIIRYPKVVVGQ